MSPLLRLHAWFHPPPQPYDPDGSLRQLAREQECEGFYQEIRAIFETADRARRQSRRDFLLLLYYFLALFLWVFTPTARGWWNLVVPLLFWVAFEAFRRSKWWRVR